MDWRWKGKGSNRVIENAVNASLEGEAGQRFFLLIVIRVPFEAASP